MAEQRDVICFYHRADKADLLRTAVLPAVVAAERAGVTAYLERHWLHGPHVRVRLRGPAGGVAEVAERTAAALRDHLAAHPSRSDRDPAQLLAEAEQAGKAELVPPPYTPIQPDNTVRVEPPDLAPLVDLLGSAAAVDCRAALLRAGVPVVADALDHLATRGDSPAARVELTVTALAAHAGWYPLGFGAGQQSFVSHVEDFLLYHDPQGTVRAGFAAQWSRNADAVTDQVARALADESLPATAERWRQWSAVADRAAGEVFDKGELVTAPGERYTQRAQQVGDPATARRWDPSARTEYSAFHQLFNQIDYRRIGHEREFAVYRFATNILYLLLGLCDVRPGERYLAAYLVGRASERITGLTWRDRIEQYLAAQAAATEGRNDR